MKGNKKLVIGLVSLIVALVAIITTTVVVLVLNGVVADTVVNIKYKAKDVLVRVTAKCYTNDDVVVFRNGDLSYLDLDQNNTSGSMSQPNVDTNPIALDLDNDRVVFEYCFTNLSNTIDAFVFLESMPGDTGVDGEASNVKITYTYSDIQIEDRENLITSEMDSRRWMLAADSVEYNKLYVYVVVEVDDYLDNSVFEGTFLWNFSRENSKPGEVAGNPIMVETTNQLVSAIKNAPEEQYTYVKLAEDIDLSQSNSLFASSNQLFETFNGEFDGSGKTIKMNTSALNDYSVLFGEVNGVIKNVTLDFGDVVMENTVASQTTTGVVFQNVTTTGSITLPDNTTNYSPFINWALGDISFIDCTNDLDIINGGTYGAIFIGGYVLDDTATSGGQVLPDSSTLKVNFIRCKNTATVKFQNASMLFGNKWKLPKFDNVTVEDCVNEGTIYGTNNADLICGHVPVTYSSNNYYAAWIERAWDEWDIVNAKDGKVIVLSDNTDVTISVNNGQYVINNTSGQSYSYQFVENIYFYITGTFSVTLTWTIDLTSSSSVNTGAYTYEFISSQMYRDLSDTGQIASKDAITDAVLDVRGYEDSTAYIITTTGGVKYYYIELYGGIDYSVYDTSNANPESRQASNYHMLALDSNNKEVAYILQYIDEV